MRDRSLEVHAGWGWALAATALAYGLHPAWTFVIVYALGWLVELTQLKLGWGTYDPTDAHYTGLGGVAGIMATAPTLYAF